MPRLRCLAYTTLTMTTPKTDPRLLVEACAQLYQDVASVRRGLVGLANEHDQDLVLLARLAALDEAARRFELCLQVHALPILTAAKPEAGK